MQAIDTLSAAMDRRTLMRMGAAAGLGAAFMPRLAFALQQPDLMANIREVVERWVGPGKFPGMIASLGLRGRETQYVARGSEGFTDQDEITPDSLFRIYSMTKPVTGMATMMLIDDGKLGLDQPLAEIIPAYADMQVQVTPDGSVTDLRPASRPITIRHLITHTSGLGYSIIQQGPIKAMMEDRGLIAGQVTKLNVPSLMRGQPVRSLQKFAEGMAGVPLVYDPGTKWSYGTGLDVMGRVVEVVSGQPFDVWLKENIFGPAGMESTFFQVPRDQASRLTTNYAVVAERLVPIDTGADSIYLDEPAFPFGGAGLVSSARDYDRFLQVLANYGTIDGTRVMGELAVRVGTSNLLPDGLTASMMGQPEAHFGAGGRVGMGTEAGVYGWAGAAGTVAMVDMIHGLRSQIMVQFMPPNALPLLPEWQKALRADIMALMERAA